MELLFRSSRVNTRFRAVCAAVLRALCVHTRKSIQEPNRRFKGPKIKNERTEGRSESQKRQNLVRHSKITDVHFRGYCEPLSKIRLNLCIYLKKHEKGNIQPLHTSKSDIDTLIGFWP